jgi:plasmid stability protein
VKVTFNLDDQLVARARRKAEAHGKSLNELIRDYLQSFVSADDPERSIAEFKHLSGRGHSRAYRFNREEIHSRQ